MKTIPQLKKLKGKCMSSKRLIVVTVLLLMCMSSIWPDAGVRSQTSWSGGSVYSEIENTKVSMAEELILLHPEGQQDYARVTVHFRFENTSENDESVPVGFPIATRFRTMDITRAGSGSPELVSLLIGRKTILPESTEKFEAMAVAKSLDSKRRELQWEQFLRELKSYGGMASAIMGDFHVTQDGTAVPMERVLIEGRKSSKPETILEIVTHMLFALRFPAHSVSSVTVDCKLFAFNEEYRGISYGCTYVLGTGRTWKGPIGRLFLVGRARVFDPPKQMTLYKDSTSGMCLVAAENYEPERDTELYLDWSFDVPDSDLEGLANAPIAGNAGERSVYDSVEVIGASSVLAGATKVAEFIVDKDYRDQPQWWSTTYGPAALFDGIRTNAWVEGAKGSGQGEYVEFELKQPALGLQVYNGLAMVHRVNPKAWYEDLAAEKLRAKQIWQRNNRVKELVFSREGGEPVTLTLEDRWGPQRFFNRFLPGRYRATIKSVYRGTQWDDTALGELTFLTVPGAGLVRGSSPELWKALWGEQTP